MDGEFYDLVAIDIQFNTILPILNLDFGFGSDEYLEYSNDIYNDTAGIFINGQNCALVNGLPLNVNSVNDINNSAEFINNDFDLGSPFPYNVEPDGFISTQNCNNFVRPNKTNTLRVVIADVSDFGIDSWVFVNNFPPENLYTLNGTFWVDEDLDNLIDEIETNLSNVNLDLYFDTGNGVFNSNEDILVSSQITNDLGNYNFPNLLPGNYFLVYNNQLLNNYISLNPEVNNLNLQENLVYNFPFAPLTEIEENPPVETNNLLLIRTGGNY